MTPRDLAFWIQGFFELGGVPGESFTDIVQKHADLVLVTEPKSEFALAVKAVADRPEALRAVVAAQFEHVIDKTFPPVAKDPAHPPRPPRPDGPALYRC